MTLIRVDGQPGLYRNTNTGAIVNTNSAQIRAARERKEKIKSQLEKSERLEAEVKEIKNDIGEIKQLLMGMLNERHHGQ